MAQASIGDTVKVDYTLRLKNGTVFDSTENREPIQFVLGQNGVISGFQNAILGMRHGESKTIKLSAEEAFGRRSEEMISTLVRERCPEGVKPTIGQQVQLKQSDGSRKIALVTQVTESDFVIDANHPLAGCDLAFDITLLELAIG